MRSDDEKRILGLWPKYEDGWYVMPGDVAVANNGAKKGRAFTVLSVRVNTVGVCLTDCDGSYWNYKAGDRRVKRPEPKVLDADGVEIKVGDTVYDTELVNGDKFTVESIDKNGDVRARGVKCILTKSSVAFTHMQPAIDADGVLIEVGDTVWSTIGERRGQDVPHEVKGFDKYGCVLLEMHNETSTGWRPEYLTHTRPDSWEQLEEDIAKFPCCYAEEVKGSKFNSCSECPWYSEVIARDIVRRAKALAEKEAAR